MFIYTVCDNHQLCNLKLPKRHKLGTQHFNWKKHTENSCVIRMPPHFCRKAVGETAFFCFPMSITPATSPELTARGHVGDRMNFFFEAFARC